MPSRKSSRPSASKARRRPTSADRDPPTVVDVRNIRRRLLTEVGGDIDALMALARRESSGVTRPTGTKRKARKVA